MELLTTEEHPASKTLQVVIFRINETQHNGTPYLEYYIQLDADEGSSHTFPETTLQEGDLSPEEIETHLFLLTCELLDLEDEKILQRDDTPIHPRGFINHSDSTYALIEVGREIETARANWHLVSEIRDDPEFADFFTEANPALIKPSGAATPIRVWSTTPHPTRQEIPHFGFAFLVSETKQGDFQYSHVLFPPPPKATCFIQKLELQEITTEVLENHAGRFIEVEAIQWRQSGVQYWCIKDILAFLPEPEAALAADASITAIETELTPLGLLYARV